MLRRARAWASAEISRLLHAEIVDARAGLETSVQTSVQSRVTELAGEVERDAQQRDQEIAASLNRLATALDAISSQLAEQSRDHRASLAAVEFVVREMALAFMPNPSASPSRLVGGTIESEMVDITMDTTEPIRAIAPEVQPRDGMGANVDAPVVTTTARATVPAHATNGDGPTDELHVGCIVEVRSRFQNRWVDGFEIAEIVTGEGAARFRLARHADHIRLPVLFDAGDLRPLDVVDDIVIDPAVDDEDDQENDSVAGIWPSLSLEPDDPGSRR